MPRVLLLANGLPPSLALLSREISLSDQFIAIDGAADYLATNNIKPDLIIGDLDSLKNHDLSPKLHIADQKTNDLDKALNYTLSLGACQVIIVGAFGLRIDHFLSNFYVLKKYSSKLNLRMIDDDQIAFMCPKAQLINIDRHNGHWLSLFPLANQVGPISTSGVLYPLNREFLSLDKRLGTLNKITSEQATIYCECSNLLVMQPNLIYS